MAGENKSTEKKLLVVTVMPDRKIIPEWVASDRKISEPVEAVQQEIYKRFSDEPGRWMFYLGFHEPTSEFSLSIRYFMSVSEMFIRELSRISDLESLRDKFRLPIPETEVDGMVNRAPMMTGSEYIDNEMIGTVWVEMNQAFSSLIRDYDGSVASFFASLNPSVHLAGRVYFHLVENKNGPLPFAFMGTYSSGMGKNGKPKHLPLKHALAEYEDDEEKLLELLSTVYNAAEKSALVMEMIDSGELFHPVAWTSDEALCFLNEISVYEEAGILCRIPDWWKRKSSGVSVGVNFGDTKPSRAGLDALLDFNASIHFGDSIISEEEARQLLSESEGLAFIKNKWVAVDHEKLKQALQVCDMLTDKYQDGITLQEAMRMRLEPEKLSDISDDVSGISVSPGRWLESVTEKLTNHERISPITPGKGFKARLRPYQHQGLNWLNMLDKLNFGACLADDMGLGKTVQILAFLSTLKNRKTSGTSLLIVPASLIANWMNEIDRFYPDLSVEVLHPGFTSEITPDTFKTRSVNRKNTRSDGPDLAITSYALAHKYEWLKDHKWHYIILDEAQAIKNPGTKQARAIKNISAYNRIIMTGTPVENKISDLWSLFDFLNPGLLGNKAEFARFSKSLAENSTGYARLRKIVSPYIMRRLKTDKSVISDLPEKMEMKSFTSLSKKQIVMYKKAVADLERRIADTEGIRRRGIVLSSIMTFKQLCNHPDQITGNGDFKEQESGKFIRLKEICETVYEKRERVLVFTQFKEMTEPLRIFLEGIFKREGLVLHGSTPVGKRKMIVEKFQQDAYCPFMVLSLKAGGVGLNLTKASHVIHFDRWWNPAVENQATDRAFRIGQRKNVVVHKFVTKGTIEEKIDMMLEDKQEVSDKVISKSGESMITEMETTELMNLFRLAL